LVGGRFIGTHSLSGGASYYYSSALSMRNRGTFKIAKGGKYYIKIGDYWYEATYSNGYYNVASGSKGMQNDLFNAAWAGGLSGYASGIENGPVTYTGLAMLHGSPSSPEYVLNSEQAGTLLKNLATMTMSPYQAPQVDSYNNGGNSTVYQFNGDMNLPNVQRPDQFFDELLKQANV
jgi:hypothetical protein